MPGDGDEYISTSGGEASSVQGGKTKPVRRFTSEELSRLNEPHNAHIAVRGKVLFFIMFD